MMNIQSIKDRADQLLFYSKPQLIRIFTIMMLINLVLTFFGSFNGFLFSIYYIIMILFLPIDHGYVVSSLKVVMNNSQSLDDNDALVGFKRFKELFSTYLLTFLVTFGITVIGILLLGLFIGLIFGNALVNISPAVLSSPAALVLFLEANPSILASIVLFLCIILVIIYIVSLYLFATPYLLEQYGLTNGRAISESVHFIKGHALDLFKLDISFIGWMILVGIVDGLASELLSFLPVLGVIISTVLSELAAIYFYLPKYQLSRAILFEEIAYQKYNVQTETYQDNSEYVENDGDVY